MDEMKGRSVESGKNKLAMVTGGSGGIGFELAKQFADHGFDVAISGQSGRVHESAEELRAWGVEAYPYQADAGTYDGVEGFWRFVEGLGRPVDAAALNVGNSIGGAFVDNDLEDEFRLIAINITGLVHMAKRVARHMVANGGGRILVTSSGSATTPTPYETVYGASKAFGFSFAESLREELRGSGVSVTALLPGATDNDFYANAGMGNTAFGDNSWKNDKSTRVPKLREDQIEALSRYGKTRKTEAGEVLFRAGDTSSDFIVVLEGEAEVVDDLAGEARPMGVMRAGRFLGDLNMLTGQPIYLSAVVRAGGEVLAIPRERLKEVVTEEPNLSDIILKAFLARHSWGIRTGLVGLRIIGSRYSGDAARLREFAARNRLPHVWVELEEDPDKAQALLERFGAKPSEAPVAIWQGKDVLKNPTTPELARAIGFRVDVPRERTYDLVVVGAGPAGLGASVYGASEGLSTLALESTALGGQAGTSSRIENYLGFPGGLSGFELASRAMVQADKFGARTAVPQAAVGLHRGDGHYRIELSEGGEVAARSVLAATGARYRRLNVDRLERFEGVSVHYAATEAEAQRCEGEDVVVVGGGNSAGQAVLFLAGRTQRVLLLIRGDDLAKGMSRYLFERIAAAENIELLPNTEVRELVGEDRLEGVAVEDNRSGARRILGARALFVFIGAEANTGWLRGAVELDERGFVLTGRELDGSVLEEDAWRGLSREPYLLETSMPGVFAAGDVRSGSIKRVASAVGEGSMAVRLVHQYLADTDV